MRSVVRCEREPKEYRDAQSGQERRGDPFRPEEVNRLLRVIPRGSWWPNTKAAGEGRLLDAGAARAFPRNARSGRSMRSGHCVRQELQVRMRTQADRVGSAQADQRHCKAHPQHLVVRRVVSSRRQQQGTRHWGLCTISQQVVSAVLPLLPLVIQFLTISFDIGFPSNKMQGMRSAASGDEKIVQAKEGVVAPQGRA